MEHKLKHTQEKLLQWYEQHGRHELPWRQTRDVYRVYLSEVMLQQTQVARVRDEYYPRFLEKFPSLEALAQAPLDEVLALWSGLGYYRRAKNLHAAAQHSPLNLPKTKQELLALPGIGSYTASAICSFAYEQDVPVVDTNIARVLKRFFALLEPTPKQLEAYGASFLNTQASRDHNLALMDLGSMVCTPMTPKCDECPLSSACLGKENAELYTKTKKKESIAMDLFFGVCIKDNKIALHYSKDNMYKNMLVLPSVDPIEENLLGVYKHAYTKYRLRIYLYRVDMIEEEGIEWVALDAFESLPISSLTKKAQQYFFANDTLTDTTL